MEYISTIFLYIWLASGIAAFFYIEHHEVVPPQFCGILKLLSLFFGIPALIFCGIMHFTKGIQKKSDEPDAPPIYIEFLDSRGMPLQSANSFHAESEAMAMTKLIISRGIQKRASDIFFDPQSNSTYQVRLRVDGTLRVITTLTDAVASGVISSIKIAAQMDGSERRRPQDGAFNVRADYNQTFAFRVATVGAFGGEKMAIRVLGTAQGPRKLEDIGFQPNALEVIRKDINLPSGMILICGPTGSGKTTTLYAFLQQLDFNVKNVISIEDPIENVIPSVSQMEVNAKANITFSSLLRNALRQNPDVICLGEIRDEETASIATQAAQTGHLILATVHSNDNLGTLDRMMSLGVPMRSLASTLRVVISQRLVRKLCHCKREVPVSTEAAELFQENGINVKKLYEPVGCPDCDHTGFSSRQPIFDILVMTSELKGLLETENISFTEVKQFIETQNNGQNQMLHDGLLLAANGETCLDEIKRVVINAE